MERGRPYLEVALAVRLLIGSVSPVHSDLKVGEAKLKLGPDRAFAPDRG
ncbi:MAG: hypothetical protein Q613_PSC00263G0002, partial [Propionibacterium sp. DORA_15]